MRNVKWTDNICTVGGTCIHGYFTGHDLELLLELCPEGCFTPTFYAEQFYRFGCGRKDIEAMKTAKQWGKSLYEQELGYYFSFMMNEGDAILTYLKEKFPMVRGEH